MKLVRASAIVLIATLLAGCSDAPTEPAARDTGSSTDGASNRPRDRDPQDDQQEARDPKNDGNATTAEEDSGSQESDDGKSSSASGDGDEESDPGAAAAPPAIPATGRYSYSQTGYERFCSGTCDRRDLPPKQTVDVFHEETGGERAVVTTQAQQSANRVARTTVAFTRAGARITKLYSRVTYGAVTFEDTIVPDPPIEAMRFPFAQDAWAGEWRDDTSGTYRIRVGEPRAVRISGRSISAYPIESVTQFSGDYQGTAGMLTWIDPETRMIVKMQGRMDLKNSFGEYTTEYRATLRSGPGY